MIPIDVQLVCWWRIFREGGSSWLCSEIQNRESDFALVKEGDSVLFPVFGGIQLKLEEQQYVRFQAAFHLAVPRTDDYTS
ncbi:hypothetical protein Bca52824_072491 [Brassica carinata]|uniref:Uncharacterized protein n=3 Tax=Brassica TaxID=3705 RepID=A0ABQ7EHF0_BRACR|nr:hypothetical protein DY000_02023580 [Brassica cretica]KAG2265412.1 hypothetical protein Bca52824_072491 [Brassica carinata]CAF1977850.1 unnamed protein product [Brassica napus]